MSEVLQPDATPDWAKAEYFSAEVTRLQGEIARRDSVLEWLAKNNPAVLELCPIKLPDITGVGTRP